jgi:hypothetical protein
LGERVGVRGSSPSPLEGEGRGEGFFESAKNARLYRKFPSP